jgi:hypothetical protein
MEAHFVRVGYRPSLHESNTEDKQEYEDRNRQINEYLIEGPIVGHGVAGRVVVKRNG